MKSNNNLESSHRLDLPEKKPGAHCSEFPRVNTKYKDSLFSFLFSDPDTLRELYCAIEGVTLPADVPITINTLEDVLFLGRVNDISFEIGGKLIVLIEHQSTINPNMALRLLIYITRVYEKILGNKNLHTARPVPLPRPEFFVLYNGEAAYPDETTLKLSDSFESAASIGLPEKINPALELEVKVININQGKNEDMARKCKTLAGYSVFVAKMREYRRDGYGKLETMKKAVNYCMKHDILKEFFRSNSTEVMSMLSLSLTFEDALALRFEEGFEDGMERGMEKGWEEGKEAVARNALAEGVSIDMIQKITGLNMETIKNLQEQAL